ncbi:hypothetical protein BGX26_010577 [Mortierella sp. AD094]|nr:hypothetical protein BGX26_010577 [Mortierella sp. AD094]
MRTMATKTYVVKANAASAAKSASTYTSRSSVSKVISAKATTAAKSEPLLTDSVTSSFSPKTYSASPISAASSSPPESLSYSDYSDDSSPISIPSGSAAKISGETSRELTEAFSNSNSTLKDSAIGERSLDDGEDWTRSFSGMAIEPFEKEVAEILMKPLEAEDIEIKPDGLLYLPEIKYRRILNKAFGPGGWGLAPRSEHSVSPKTISREYALVCRGRFVSTARGEQDYFDPSNLATASEGCKSNALMRCCKDLGIASELWDPSFIRKFKKQYCEELFAEHVITKRKKKLWKRKDQPDFEYPYSKGKRKRKWDNQGEDDTAVKRTASEGDTHSKEGSDISNTDPASLGQGNASGQSAAEAAAAAAAIAAARLNAKLVAQGKPPVETDAANSALARSAESQPDSNADASSSGTARDAKERDEFVHNIDINDVKHRYYLTKGSYQTELQRETGADITTRGRHYSDRSLATEKDPPLYLHVTALTQEALDLAVKKINELIEKPPHPTPLPPQRESFQPNPRMHGGPPRHQSFHARVAIGIESDRLFNVRAKVVGPGGQYVKHVQNETKTRVQLKGYGSGYLEVDTGRESDEPLYINIIGNSQEDVDAAERLCKDLVETVKAEHERMKSRPPMPQEPYGHNRNYGGRPNYNNGGHYQRYQGGHHQYQQQPHHQYNYNQHYQAPSQHPGAPTPPSNPPLPPGPPPPPADQSAPTTPTTVTAAASATTAGDAATTADQSSQGYTYEQYEAYNQYYYQQQYYQQYGQYYQQAYAQPGVEQGQGVPASGAGAAVAPVSSDPALAYYGYAYAPPPPPPTDTMSATPTSSTDAAQVPPPPTAGNLDYETRPSNAEEPSLAGSGGYHAVPPPPEV